MSPKLISRPALLLTLALLSPKFAPAQDPASPAEARLRADVAFLADDAQEGRAPGTKGIEASADYIAEAFKKAGLKPAADADGYFQPFSIRGVPRLEDEPKLAVLGPDGKALVGRAKVDFMPLAVGGSGDWAGLPLVFAGYGISAKEANSGLDYDDYDGIDPKGKAVLILRHAPQQDKEGTPFHGNKAMEYGSFRHKATIAYQRGAKAVLMVNDLAGLKGGKDELLGFDAAGSGGSGVPFFMLSRDFAERIAAAAGLPGLEELEKGFQDELKPHPREAEGWTVDASVKIGRESIATKNVVGVLEGEGPHADETIVVGAHYDHLGHGGFTSGSLAPASTSIHNGADDNASGTSLVMELARRLGRRADAPPRRIVFMAFSGEERGLLGSAHYVNHPLYPLSKTVMMLNFDMVGRLDDKDDLSVYGTNSSPGLDAIVDALGKAEGFTIKKATGAFGMGDRFSLASDHASFFMKGIPYLFFFTGVHRDYHRPSDDTDLINVAGMARIADFGEVLLLDVLHRPRRPEFVKGPSKNDHGHAGGGAAQDPAFAGAGRSAYLGTIPDYGGDDQKDGGVKLSGVTDGSPAEKGGIKGGDIVVKFDGKPVATLEDYTETLRLHKPGDAVDVVVKRDGKDVTLKVTLGSRGDAAK